MKKYGDEEIKRFEMRFSELAAEECMRIEDGMRRRVKRWQ